MISRVAAYALRICPGFPLVCVLIASYAHAELPVPLPAVQQNISSSRVLSLPGPGLIQRTQSDFRRNSLGQAEPQPEIRPAPTSRTLAVIYPDIGEPFRSIFMQIIQGIETAATHEVVGYPVAGDSDAAEINRMLDQNDTKGIIALGRQGLRIASSADQNIPLVIGGVLAVPKAERRSLVGISLAPDPALLFKRLKSLLPRIKRVTVIYNPQQNEWLIKLAHEAAKSQGLELIAWEARDLGSAARLYEAAFASSDSGRDAIWLPQDSTTVDENTILPLVLKESWNRSVPVFSSSFLHVKKGALFALYPDNIGLGKALARSAEDAVSDDTRRRGVVPLRDVFVAVNLRTASHIGLNIGYQQQRSFDFIFPEP